MPKKRSKGKARLTAQPMEESGGIGLSPTDFFTVSQPMKVCRLCESKDGPFLNIFEADKVTAKKIEELMPFGVAENDDLPHKICFRCSAKVEELHEFIQKCINTQINLRTTLGKKDPFIPKLKKGAASLWNETLNKSNVSNDDICDAVIKKAMEGIKDIPTNPLPLNNRKVEEKSELNANKPGSETVENKATESSELIESSKDVIDLDSDCNAGDELEQIKKQTKMTRRSSITRTELIEKATRSTRRNSISKTLRSNTEGITNGTTTQLSNKPQPTVKRRQSVNTLSEINAGQLPIKPQTATKRTSDSTIVSSNKKTKLGEIVRDETNSSDTAKKSTEKAREQVSICKGQMTEVTNVNITPSDEKDSDQSTQKMNAKAITEKPFDIMDHVSMIKVNGVGVLFQCKLCNRNFLKMDVVQSHSCAKNRCLPEKETVKKITPPKSPKPPTVKYINTKLGDHLNITIPETSNSSNKTNTNLETTVTEGSMKPKPRIGPASKVKRETKGAMTSDEGPPGRKKNNTPTPNLNCPYKLVPGPNNTFTLVEEAQEHGLKPQKLAKKIQESQNVEEKTCKQRQLGNDSNYVTVRNSNSNKIVTLPTTGSMIFSATAAQRQSYSVVQTGNPSKLLISAKPQQRAEEHMKNIKAKVTSDTQQRKQAAKPFSVTLDDTSRPIDPDTFSVLNVDPLLTPSYVLPISNESQSVTMNNDRFDSTAPLLAESNGHYTCNMCNEVFTREQKLLAHIHSHYNKMDKEDNMRVSKTSRKRMRKS